MPLAILLISDLSLPAYNSYGVMIATYGIMIVPIYFGRLLRTPATAPQNVLRWAVCGLVPATLFYLVSNFSVWAFQSDYAKTWAGLVRCYWAAAPFYRWMLAGDVFYLALLFGCAALAGVRIAATQAVEEIRDSESNAGRLAADECSAEADADMSDGYSRMHPQQVSPPQLPCRP